MTANELIENFFEEQYRDSLLDGSIVDYQDDIKTLMIQFAKLHVEAALKAASEKADAKADNSSSLRVSRKNLYWTFAGNIGDVLIDKESILNSYPLTNVI